MSIAYQSIQSNSDTDGSVTVTKPTNLAVGDLMVCGMVGLGSSSTNTLPSGFTTIRNQTANSAITTTGYKVATSSDVAASNFTFTNSNNSAVVAFITRWTGTITVDQNNGSELTGTASFSSSGITPTYVNSYFLIVTGYYNSGATRSISAQAIATNNPSWTEILDGSVNAASEYIGISVAYGSRPEITASGNATATGSGACDNAKLQVFNLDPRQYVDTSDSVTVSDTVSSDPVAYTLLTTSVSDSTSTSDSQTTKYGWTNEQKSSAPTWTNEQKS